MMLQCWDPEPQSRPTFSDIVASLSQSLEAMADYLDINAFGNNKVKHDQGVDQASEPEKEDTQEKTDERQVLVEESKDN